MTSSEWLGFNQVRLEEAGIETARLDALVLLEDELGVDRARLLAEPGTELSAGHVARLEKLLRRRARHEPLAYVRSRAEFYGREFVLTPAVLVPRPESEAMIELLKQLVASRLFAAQAGGTDQRKSPAMGGAAKQDRIIRVADVGAGSGALGITAVLEVPAARVELLEIDPAALAVAQINVDKFTLNILVIQSNLLAQAKQDYDILLCNLPYVPENHPINAAARHEPRLAIFGGPDGLDLYRRLFQQIDQLTRKPLYILTEALPAQHAALRALAEQAGYQLRQAEDFIQLFELP